MEKFIIEKELVEGNLRFVITVAKQYQNQGLDLCDLIAEGNLGLIKAIKNFDWSKNLRFISYAVWWVKQSIIASLNENGRTIRLPSNLVQENQKLKKEKNCEEYKLLIARESEDNYDPNLPYCVGLYSEINEENDQLLDIIPNKNADNSKFELDCDF